MSIEVRLSAGEHVFTAADVKAMGGPSAIVELRKSIESDGDDE